MLGYYPSLRPSKALQSIIILVLLLVIVAVVTILFSSFLPHGLSGSLTVILLFGILTLVSYIVARSIGLKDPRSPKQKRVTILLCFGFASFFGYGALVVSLLGHPLRFPINLPLLLAAVLAAVLTALIADSISKRLGSY